MTQPILVLAEGTLRYQERTGAGYGGERTVRVFIVDWQSGNGVDHATVVFREPAWLHNEGVPVPVGGIRNVLAGVHQGDEFDETLLTLDIEALVPA